VISTNGGTTYWSLPDYVSTWGGMDGSAQESWRTLNNYVGTYTDTPAASIPAGDARVDGPTTWWRSEPYMATMSSLASIDSGMAQVSWTKHNVFSGGNSSMPASTGSPAGLSVQMNSVAGASSSPDPSSVQSGNTAISQASNGVGSSLGELTDPAASTLCSRLSQFTTHHQCHGWECGYHNQQCHSSVHHQ
jgi:hypothetical protein